VVLPLDEQLVKQARLGGVTCRLLIESATLEDRHRQSLQDYSLAGVEVRQASSLPMKLAVFDGRRGMIALLDPVLRRRDLDARKKETWIEDQYRHPLERLLPFPGVTVALEAQGFLWVRSVPPATTADEIFTPTPRPGALALFGRRLNWAWRCLWDEDAGLVCVVLRRGA